MFFRKKNEEKKQERAETRQRILGDIDKRLAETEALVDAGEKLVRYKRLEDDISKESGSIRSEAETDAFIRGLGRGLGIFGVSTAAAIWLAASVTGWGLLVVIPGLYAAGKLGSRSSESLQTRRDEENKEFYAGMAARRDAVVKSQETLVENEWASIAKSAKANEAFNAVPKLREKYASAYCKGVANGDIATQGGAASSPVATDTDAQSAVTSQAPIGINHSLKLKKPAAG